MFVILIFVYYQLILVKNQMNSSVLQKCYDVVNVRRKSKRYEIFLRLEVLTCPAFWSN